MRLSDQRLRGQPVDQRMHLDARLVGRQGGGGGGSGVVRHGVVLLALRGIVFVPSSIPYIRCETP